MALNVWLTWAVTLLLCGVSSAQPAPTPAPVVSLLFPMGNVDGEVHWLGSVISAVPSATTYSLDCYRPGDEDEEDDMFENPGPPCGFAGVTAIQGPATYSLAATVPPRITFNFNCQVEGATQVTRAICTGGQPDSSEDTMETVTQEAPGIRSIPVTVTAGAEKLSAPPPTETVTPTPDAAPPRLASAAPWALGGMAAAMLAGAV